MSGTGEGAPAGSLLRDPVCGMPLDPRAAPATAEHGGRLHYFCSDGCRKRFLADPERYTRRGVPPRLSVGVMGSAVPHAPRDVAERAYLLGQEIARRGYVLVTGACPGLPYECARGVRNFGGLSVGISPALSLDEHIHKYHSPVDAYDVIVYTGSGLMGREVTNIRSSDLVIILGGRSGTLGEFAIAYDEGRLIGVLEGSGGIADRIRDIVAAIDKDTGAQVLHDRDPVRLLDALARAYARGHYRRPSCFCGEMAGEAG